MYRLPNFYIDYQNLSGNSDAEMDMLDNSQDFKFLAGHTPEVAIEVRLERMIWQKKVSKSEVGREFRWAWIQLLGVLKAINTKPK